MSATNPTTNSDTTDDTGDDDTGTVSCSENDECGKGYFCDYPDHACGQGAKGQCAPMPWVCPDSAATVVGCDCQIYGNECEAHAAGVDVMCGPTSFVAIPPPTTGPDTGPVDTGACAC